MKRKKYEEPILQVIHIKNNNVFTESSGDDPFFGDEDEFGEW